MEGQVEILNEILGLMKNQILNEFNEIALTYDSERKALIPCFDDFYQIIVDLSPIEKGEEIQILDVGAGTGLLTQFLLLKYPNASFTLIDISEEMLKVARQRFLGKKNISYITSDYTKFRFDDEFDLVASALSIHHLINEEKAEFYVTIFDLLTPDGIFINGDQFAGTSEYNESIYQTNWISKIKSTELTRQQKKGAYKRMKIDKTATLNDNLNWLINAGFRDVDVFYKYFNFGIIRGRK